MIFAVNQSVCTSFIQLFCSLVKLSFIALYEHRESSFNMARERMKILRAGGLRKFLDTRKGGSEKNFRLGGGAPKICILQNQQEGGLLKN